MPSVRYYNQTAPFWDFVANLEEQGFGNRAEGAENENERSNPWSEGWGDFPFGGFPHRGRHGPPHHHHHGPPPPPDADPDTSVPTADDQEVGGPPPPFSEHGPNGGHAGTHRGRCGGRGRGGWGGRGRGGPFGGRHGPFPPMGGLGALAEMFQSQLFADNENANKEKSEDFKPDVDVFDAPEAFVIHVSLPGAKKEDVGVNWDADKSEISIAGVIYRPGDEELLKTLALDERKIGAFERKVRLGSRANPAQVDVDGITARMEDGVLRVEVPKLDSGYVEVKKVDIE